MTRPHHTYRFIIGQLRLLPALVILAATTVVSAYHAPNSPTAIITVNSNADVATPGDGLCTLREALVNANADTDSSGGDCAAGSGMDTITFAIGAGGSLQTITVGSNLPTISAPVVLDGWTQGGSGYNGPPLIEIDGGNLSGSSSRGLRITGGGSTVRGLVIHSFDDSGSSAIWLHTSGDNWISGNYIGVSADGTSLLPNTYGIWIDNWGNDEPSPDNVIGTNGDGVDDDLEGNVIAGSIQEDLRVETEGNWIAGNRIGTTPDGSAAFTNSNSGVRLFAANNIVGTNGDGLSDNLEGNLISGHDTGIGINNSGGHAIAGNIIGLDAAGATILGNSGNGIDCNASAANSRDIIIGSNNDGISDELEGNVISGNGSRGFSTFYDGCRHITISGNKIGASGDGSAAPGNGAEGVIISAGDWITITNNIISGNGTNGIANGITSGNGANNLTIRDNIIGSDADGTVDLGNTGYGIEISFSDNQTMADNQISGNGLSGILISSSDGALVENNLIGVQADGSSALSNGDDGVNISGDAANNTVAGNTIAYNERHGIVVDGSQARGNTFSANAIFGNTELGIDLDLEGVTPTDQDDVDAGPNGLQNHPAILSAANSADQITIEGVLDSTPETTFRLEFFSNSACDPSGNGEGADYLGSDTITTLSGSGAANDTPYSVTLPVLVPQGRYLSATATGPEGTGEFAVCFGPTGAVQDSPISDLTAHNDGPQLDHHPLELAATVSSGSNVTYEWDPGDGSGPLSGQSVNHTYQTPGTYTAVVTATNAVSQESASTEVIVNRSSSLNGHVWDDVDGDGRVGPGEIPLPGETVRAEQNGRVFTAITDADGVYLLHGLRAGSYTVYGPSISGYKSLGAGVRILSMPATGAAVGLRLPYRADFSGVRGRAWQDDNFDGRYDPGETLLANHPVNFTAVGGGVSFFNIPTDGDGLYQINANGDAVGDRHVLSSDAPALYQPISRTLNAIYQAGFTANLAFRPGAIGGCVSGTGGATEHGLTVALRDASGQDTATVMTDSDGCYVFSPAEAEDAIGVRLTPAGSDLIVGPASQSAVYLGTPLQIDWDVTAPGSVQIGVSSVDSVSVSGGQSTVSGYEVHLETGGGVLTATTGFNGLVTFDSVPPGPITATVPLSGGNIGAYPASWSYDLPAGGSIIGPGFRLGSHGITATCTTPPVPGQEPEGRSFSCTVDVYRFGQSTAIVSQSLAAGEQFFYQPGQGGMFWIELIPDNPNALKAIFVNSLAAGQSRHYRYPHFLPDQLGPISGEVWTDANANGTREWSEGPAVGFSIELLSSDGSTVLDTTTTDTHGRYHLYPDGFGAFRVRIAPPASVLPTTAEMHIVQRDAGDVSGDVVNFGIAVMADILQGRIRFNDVWHSHASGVTVQLRSAANEALLDTISTGPAGTFSFDGLLPDDYLLRVLPPNGDTAVERLVTATLGGTPFQEIILPPDGNRPTVFVYADENGNGVADEGEGVPGVSVAFDAGVCGNVFDVNITDGDGFAPSALVFPNGGCARATGGLPEGLSPARPDGVTLAAYDGGLVSLRLVAQGSLQLRPYWDRNGNGLRDPGEPLRLDDVSVFIPGGLSLARSQHELHLLGSTGTYDTIRVSALSGSSAVVLQPQPMTGIISSLTEHELTIPLAYENSLTGEVIGPNSGAVSGLTIELRDEDNSLTATTTTGVAAISQPGGRSYTPPAAATGGPAAASFAFDDVAPGSYTLRVANPPPNMVTSPADISFDPASSGSVQLRINPIDTLSGVVYWDHDYDGRRDNGEPGAQFYDVVLLNDSGLPEQQVTPAADGTFVFSGLQIGVQYALTVPELVEVAGAITGNWITSSPGWFIPGSLSHAPIGIGHYNTDNPSSLAAGQVYVRHGTSRIPAPGATVGYYQLQSTSGLCNAADPSILGQTTTDTDGRYRLPVTFNANTFVDYCLVVLEAPGLVQDDLSVTAEASYCMWTDASFSVWECSQVLSVDSDIRMREVSEGGPNRPASPSDDTYDVTWSAFRDDNLNGLWDEGEFPLPGVLLDSGDGSASSRVDGSGLLHLPAGEQVLSITPPAGYTPLGPGERTVWLLDSSLSLPPIGFAPHGLVSGIVFADKDGDGWPNKGNQEFGLGQVTVTLDGPAIRTTVTSADGRFQVSGLPDGTYTVSAEVPAGYVAAAVTMTVRDGTGVARIAAQSTSHLSGAFYQDWDGDDLRLFDEPLASSTPFTVTVDVLGDALPLGGSVLFWDVAPGTYTIRPWWTAANETTVTLNQTSGGSFRAPAVPAGMVRGTLWLDADGDGARQPWETPLSGVAVTLDNGATVLSDADGRYRFANVPAGQHTLTATLPQRLETSLPDVITSDTRGAAVGIAVTASTDRQLFLPLIRH